MSLRWALYVHSLLKYSSLNVEIWKPQFSGKIVLEKRMKIEDQEGEVGKLFLNMTSANLLCTSSTLGPHGKPGINPMGKNCLLKKNGVPQMDSTEIISESALCCKYMWMLHRLGCGMPFDAARPKNLIGKLLVPSKEAARHMMSKGF